MLLEDRDSSSESDISETQNNGDDDNDDDDNFGNEGEDEGGEDESDFNGANSGDDDDDFFEYAEEDSGNGSDPGDLHLVTSPSETEISSGNEEENSVFDQRNVSAPSTPRQANNDLQRVSGSLMNNYPSPQQRTSQPLIACDERMPVESK